MTSFATVKLQILRSGMSEAGLEEAQNALYSNPPVLIPLTPIPSLVSAFTRTSTWEGEQVEDRRGIQFLPLKHLPHSCGGVCSHHGV